MNFNEQVKVNAFAEAADREVGDEIRVFLEGLEVKHAQDPYKAAIVGNVMMSNGIAILLHMNMPPDALLEIIVEQMKLILSGDDKIRVPYAMPADVVALVEVKGEAS